MLVSMGRRLALALLLGGLGLACGPRTIHRPVELFVGGLSGRAAALVVLVFPESAGVGCVDVSLATVQTLDAPTRAEWRRAEMPERGLQLEATDEGEITVVVYAEDEVGAAIQLACRQVDYADLEVPEISLQLSARE